jgi:hypothetical protein
MYEESKRLLSLFGVPYIVAPSLNLVADHSRFLAYIRHADELSKSLAPATCGA